MSDEELAAPPPPIIKGCSSMDGDWECEDCGNVNFARRNNCNRCNKNKALNMAAARKRKLGTEIGKAAAKKSRGLFSADDWQCNKCGNVNWARRQSCNVCNAPKFGEVEERTGFGGGYNDRGVVEYKEREDSDDEYDDFGRKKKKTQSRYDIEKIEKRHKVEEKPRREEEDDDEDEDEEDGDLSKYDLSDWGDLPVATNKNERSRSRSKSPVSKIR